jgi:AhpD family alkylhydroperoxidase
MNWPPNWKPWRIRSRLCWPERRRIGRPSDRSPILAPNAAAGFFALDKGASKTVHLEAKTRELIAIAIAIAVTTRCDGCIGVHTERAINAGATREEVAEALGVAVALNAGAAMAYSARVLDAYAAIDGAAKSAAE